MGTVNMTSSCLLFCLLLGITSSCVVRINDNFRTTDDECEQLKLYEILASHFCPHGNGWKDGFTWNEVYSCEDTVSSFGVTHFPFDMPTKDEFEDMDIAGDGNGILSLEEWKNFVG